MTVERVRESPGSLRRTILVVDADATVYESLARALMGTIYAVRSACSGAAAIMAATLAAPSLVLIDEGLADIAGLDILDIFRSTPSIVMIAEPRAPQVAAMTRRGSFDVLTKPIDIERLVLQIPAIIRNHEAEAPNSWNAHPPSATRSTAERWAWFVIKACTARRDLKTLGDWAKHVGVSYSTLAESSRIVGVRPHDARDFTRVLRAVIRARLERCSIDVLLDVRDRRTLRNLIAKTGLDPSAREAPSVDDYLTHQMFVSASNEGLQALRRALRHSGESKETHVAVDQINSASRR